MSERRRRSPARTCRKRCSWSKKCKRTVWRRGSLPIRVWRGSSRLSRAGEAPGMAAATPDRVHLNRATTAQPRSRLERETARVPGQQTIHPRRLVAATVAGDRDPHLEDQARRAAKEEAEAGKRKRWEKAMRDAEADLQFDHKATRLRDQMSAGTKSDRSADTPKR